ncbi:MAG: hypothetical protein RLZ98_3123 [Pseudomonadota bacterium]
MSVALDRLVLQVVKSRKKVGPIRRATALRLTEQTVPRSQCSGREIHRSEARLHRIRASSGRLIEDLWLA